jgi:dTDP-glucose 4,6-dehydratase|tara:strand:- start:612 stop:1511 length:900 start_codon:yes stop_codon:yes gene_type:complete
MRIVITGALGFIGSHFAKYLFNLDDDIKILVIDNCTYAANKNNLKGVTYEHLHRDICDVTAEDLGEYDYLVNFAAESHVDNSIKDGRPFVRTNVEGTFNLLEVARQNPNLKKFVQISTDEVYGDMDDLGPGVLADEEFSIIGSSYYSSTKASADLLVQAAGRTYGLPYLITRTCNNYGENQHQEKLLPTIINCVRNNLKIPIYGDGQNVREWIHADDNSMVIFNLLNSNSTGIHNIGSGERYTNLQIIEIIEKILGYQLELKFVEDRKGHDRAYGLLTKYKPILNHTLIKYLQTSLDTI